MKAKQAFLVLAFFISLHLILKAQQPPQQDKNVTITLKLSEWNKVITGIQSLPYGEVAGIMEQISSQANAQLNPPPKPVVPKKDSTGKKN